MEVFAAALEELGSRPTIAVIEDVHWADEATLDLLRYLGRRLEGTTALLIATYRDDEIGSQHPLRLVLGDVETARRVALPRLTEDGVRTLAEGSEVDPQDLYRQTGGNPFFVTEVLAAGVTGVPASVRDAVLARAARLDGSARTVLDAAAVAGMEADLPLLEAICGEAPRGLDECLAAGVLQSRPGGVGFRHELARRAIEEAIDPARRAELHSRALDALSISGDSARLAHHAEAAGDGDAVLGYARAAAERAAERGAHREAAEQYARCLRFADGLPSEEIADLLEHRSRECSFTLQVEEALSAGLSALERYRELGNRLKEGELLSWSSRLLYWAARIEEAEDAAHEGGQDPRAASSWTRAGAGIRAHGRATSDRTRRPGRHHLGRAGDRARGAARRGRDRRQRIDGDRSGGGDARQRHAGPGEGACACPGARHGRAGCPRLFRARFHLRPKQELARRGPLARRGHRVLDGPRPRRSSDLPPRLARRCGDGTRPLGRSLNRHAHGAQPSSRGSASNVVPAPARSPASQARRPRRLGRAGRGARAHTRKPTAKKRADPARTGRGRASGGGP